MDSIIEREAPAVDAQVVDVTEGPAGEELNPVAAYVEENLPANALDKSVSRFSVEDARELTDRVRTDLVHIMEAMYEFRHDIEKAWVGRVWVALGYAKGMKGWSDYCRAEFADARLRVTAQQRNEIIAGFDRDAMISTRALAEALGVGKDTVYRARGRSNSAPAKVRGVDGNMYLGKQLPAQDRRQLHKDMLEMHERGMTQMEIAEKTGYSQSQVSTICKEQNELKVSEGMQAAAIPDDITSDVLDSDEPIVSSEDGVDGVYDLNADNVGNALADASEAFANLCDQMDEFDWQPDGPQTQSIAERHLDDMVGLAESMGRFVRLLTTAGDEEGGAAPDPDDVLVELLGEGKGHQRFVGVLVELLRILEGVLD